MKSGNENREERNNRRNRDQNFNNGPAITEFNRDDNNVRHQRRGGGSGRDAGNQNTGGRRNYDGRGKREFDRQSGSDKTGIKAIDKRDGAGAHNWGSHKQDIDDMKKAQTDYANDGDISKDNKDGDSDPQHKDGGDNNDQHNAPDDEVKEMTLDEYKAQKAASRSKPKYNLRKAGEGEDLTQWKKMVALDKKKITVSLNIMHT